MLINTGFLTWLWLPGGSAASHSDARFENVWSVMPCNVSKIKYPGHTNKSGHIWPYTVRQFYGITLPVRPSSFTAYGNQCQFQYDSVKLVSSSVIPNCTDKCTMCYQNDIVQRLCTAYLGKNANSAIIATLLTGAPMLFLTFYITTKVRITKSQKGFDR